MALDPTIATGNASIDLILEYVLDDTKRPDMHEIIKRRITRAIRKYHRLDIWKKDLVEQVYVFDQPVTAMPAQPAIQGANALFLNSMAAPNAQLYIQVLNKDKLARYRFVQYLRKWQTVTSFGDAITDPTTGGQGTVQGGDLTERNPDRMFDGYGYDLTDTYYESGNTIRINSSTPLSQVFIGYFADPVLEPIANTSSWIATKYPDLIAAEVKQRIFNDIGRNEEANAARGEIAAEVLLLQANNITLSMK